MLAAAERNGKLIADLHADDEWLGKSQMIEIEGCRPQIRQGCDANQLQMCSVPYPKRRVWPDCIVVLAPLLDDDLSLLQVAENFTVLQSHRVVMQRVCPPIPVSHGRRFTLCNRHFNLAKQRHDVLRVGPRSCYDEGKRCAETLFFDYRRQHSLRIKVARIFNTYWPRMHPNDGRVVSNFIVQALLGRDLTVYGEGSQTRSFCYVDDLIDGLLRLMATDDAVTGPVNIGNPGEFSILELATTVIEMTGARSRIAHKPLPENDPRQRQPDISLAKQLLSWQPRTPLREGLTRTIAYFEGLLRDNAVRTSLEQDLC